MNESEPTVAKDLTTTKEGNAGRRKTERRREGDRAKGIRGGRRKGKGATAFLGSEKAFAQRAALKKKKEKKSG